MTFKAAKISFIITDILSSNQNNGEKKIAFMFFKTALKTFELQNSLQLLPPCKKHNVVFVVEYVYPMFEFRHIWINVWLKEGIYFDKI